MFRTPPLTKNLIIINLLLYFATIVGVKYGFDLNELFGLHFFLAPNFNIFQLFTYMFLHANFTHLFFNMFALWMFGRTMESVWGPKKFIVFYLLCGIGAGLCQELAQYTHYYIEGLYNYNYITDGNIRMTLANYLGTWTTIGASGACYGILLGFGMTFPNERILLLIPPIPIKAKYFVIGYAVIELFFGVSSSGDNVAHFAHLGGMLVGWLIILYWRHKAKSHNSFRSWNNYKPRHDSSFFSRNKYASKAEKKEAKTHQSTSTHQTEMDEINNILSKIKTSGYESLTEEEKKKLFDVRNS
ncbi:MAG: rhomboid family intramembrane serine protease [Prevotellaceae bacterium]|nr:rhomboid family intramembrane serine protease [Candidatus Faecinaster equi]